MSKQSDDLVREIDEIRDRLANNVDELVTAIHPKSIMARGLKSVKGRFVDETGSVRTETVVPLAAGAVALIAGAIVLRRLLN